MKNHRNPTPSYYHYQAQELWYLQLHHTDVRSCLHVLNVAWHRGMWKQWGQKENRQYLALKSFWSWKIRRENSVIWNHIYSDSIHVNPKHNKSNQLVPDNSTNIGTINNLSDIHEIEKMLSSPIPTPQTFFNYGRSSDPPSTLHDLPEESVTAKGNSTSYNNPPNLVPTIPADPDSYISSSYSSLSYSSDSSDYEYSK